MLMMKGLIDYCLSHETALERVRAKAKATVEELEELKAWKVILERKLALSEQVWGELEKQTKVMRKALEEKEGEIKDVKDQLR